MTRARISFFLIPLLLLFASTAFSMAADDVEREVIRLFRQSEFIPQIRITPSGKDQFVIELTFNIGDWWGRDEFVRHLAKAAITRVLKSDLPLAQGIVRIYCTHTEIIHLAVGINQIKQMRWKDSDSLSEFFDTLRSRFHWGKKPEDRTYFIERGQIIKPSPAISFPPNS